MKKGITRAGVLWAGAMMAAGCAGESGEWRGSVTDSAGVEIVTNPPTGIWSAADRPRVEEEIRIGSAGGDEKYQFGLIAGIDVGADGTIYVLDQQAATVRAFDPEGVYLRTIGSPGSGPGELSRMTFGVVVTAGDTLLVPDMAQQRVTRFTSDGSVLGSFPIPMAEGLSVRWAVGPDGRLVQQTRIMNFPGQTERVEPKDLLLLRDATGALLDTLMTLPTGRTLQMDQDAMMVKFFDAEPIWALGEEGAVYFAMNSDYSIQEHGPDGRLRRIVRRAADRKPVTASDQAAFLKVIREMYGRQGLPPQAIEMVMANTSFAEFYPAFANLMGGPGGTLWVQRIQTAAEVEAGGAEYDLQDVGSPIWDIFAPDGRYLGEIGLPERFSPLRVIGDHLYGVWRDELDVQYASRVRIDGLGGR